MTGPRAGDDVALAGDALAGSVSAKLVERFASPYDDVWELRLRSQRSAEEWVPIDPLGTLESQGVVDGSTLRVAALGVIDPSTVGPEAAARRNVRVRSVLDRTTEFLPGRVSGVRRLTGAVGSLLDAPAPRPEDDDVSTHMLTQRRGPVSRWRAAMASTGYVQRLDRAIASGRMQRSGVIAVMSPGTGAGRTTTTELIGSILAKVRHERVVALDAHPAGGPSLATLVPEHTGTVQGFVDARRGASGRAAADQFLGHGPDRLRVLPAGPDAGGTGQLYDTAIRRLCELAGIVIVDCPSGIFDPVSQAVLALADQIVLVTDIDKTAGPAVAQAVHDVSGLHLPITLVVNRWPTRADRADFARTVEFIERWPSVTATHIPESVGGAEALAEGTFTWATAPVEWQDAVREAATVLVGQWEQPGVGVVVP